MNAAAFFGFTGLLLAVLLYYRVVDHDIYHAMSLWRATLELGHVPKVDLFAFTPTIEPSIHHEWGSGAVYYTFAKLGAPAFLALRMAVIAGIGVMCVLAARRAGASFAVICILAPIAILLMRPGIVSTIRAQLFTLLGTATLLYFIRLDENGRRWWIAAWFPMLILWLNLHGGFVVGLILLGVHWFERVIRTREPQWHLVAVGAASAACILVNPWGIDYPLHLIPSITMKRDLIHEWQPLWKAVQAPVLLAGMAAALLTVAYSGFRIGLRGLLNVTLIALTAYAALKHMRHVTIFGVVWLALAPAYLQQTPIGELASNLWGRRPRVVAAAFILLGLGGFAVAFTRTGPLLEVPSVPAKGPLIYPVGPVEYLRSQQFRGNLMTPFRCSSYAMWHLWPDVKISMDSRYEAAYAPGVMERIHSMYAAQDGWQLALRDYNPDLILVPTTAPLSKLLPQEPDCTRIYADDAWEIYAPTGTTLPIQDRRGQNISGRFP